jgi:hypothetical protein
MAQIGLTEAARLARRNQSTIHRAMQAGRLSYSTDSAGKRVVDVAELDRVFGVKVGSDDATPPTNGASLDGHAHAAERNAAHARFSAVSPGEHAALHQLLADREASIADLRGRLDASEAERRQLSERLTAILTDQREQKPIAAVGFPLAEPNLFPEETSSAPPGNHSELTQSTEPSASSGLAISRPPWWRRWFR